MYSSFKVKMNVHRDLTPRKTETSALSSSSFSADATVVNASIQVYRYLYPESAGRPLARPRSLRLASASPQQPFLATACFCLQIHAVLALSE